MKSRKPKRSTVDASVVEWRKRFLRDLRRVAPPVLTPGHVCPSLEAGNTKIGRSGRFAGTMLVWNLPAIATCPGASNWCSAHCYNADARLEKFPLEQWRENWAWTLERPTALKERIVEQIHEADPPVGVRIHSSGDFYSVEYVEFWIAICRACPKARFWAYTRSWQMNSMSQALAGLRDLENVQLFASWDATMPSPPQGWRLSIVDEGGLPPSLPNTSRLVCPEQDGLVPDCANCGYCFIAGAGDVRFALH